MEGVTDCLKIHKPSAVPLLISFLVVVIPVINTSSDGHHITICPTHKNEVELFPFDTIYFGANSSSVSLRVFAAGDCLNEKHFLKLDQFTEANITSVGGGGGGGDMMSWYEYSYCGNNVARIGSVVTKYKRKFESECMEEEGPVTLKMRPNIVFARECSGEAESDVRIKTKIVCLEILKDITTTTTSSSSSTDSADKLSSEDLLKLFDDLNSSNSSHISVEEKIVRDREKSSVFGGKGVPDDLFESLRDSKSPLLESMGWPKNYDDILDSVTATRPDYDSSGNEGGDGGGYYDGGGSSTVRKSSHYKENAIPIFIGIVAFSISMCLRFCLCHAKSVVRRVTTVTVIRSVSDGVDHSHLQDPPPSYVDVVSSHTSQGEEPPPPAYADIVDDVNLPTYSEVESQTSPPREEVQQQLSEQQDTQGSNAPSDSDTAPPDEKGAPSPAGSNKNALTKYRCQQKQFSFKVLDEDE